MHSRTIPTSLPELLPLSETRGASAEPRFLLRGSGMHTALAPPGVLPRPSWDGVSFAIFLWNILRKYPRVPQRESVIRVLAAYENAKVASDFASLQLSNAPTENTKRREVAAHECFRLAGPTGLEPATSGVTGRRSNRLNYDFASG